MTATYVAGCGCAALLVHERAHQCGLSLQQGLPGRVGFRSFRRALGPGRRIQGYFGRASIVQKRRPLLKALTAAVGPAGDSSSPKC